MHFRASLCEPLEPAIIELGDVTYEQVFELFHRINWSDFLKSMEGRGGEEIFYSPSFEVENRNNGHSICISAIGEADDFEFHIFYKRPKAKTVLGVFNTVDNTYTSDKDGQMLQDALDCLEALLRSNHSFLERKIGE